VGQSGGERGAAKKKREQKVVFLSPQVLFITIKVLPEDRRCPSSCGEVLQMNRNDKNAGYYLKLET